MAYSTSNLGKTLLICRIRPNRSDGLVRIIHFCKPEPVRILASGTQAAPLKAVKRCRSYLPPFFAMHLAENRDRLIHSSLTSLSIPDVYLRLREVMEAENSNLDDIARVLSLDPALTTRILRIANSAMYGLRSQVETVSRAANVLGLQEIHNLALAAGVSKAVEHLDNTLMDLNTFWYRSVQCAFLAKTLAEGAGMRGAESLFIRGLLHDIGHLLMFTQHPRECRQALAKSDCGLQARLDAEEALMGVNALQLMAELANEWRLPNTFAQSFSHLMRPEVLDGTDAREVALLQVAVQLTNGLDADLLLEQVLQHIDPSVWQLAELPPEVAAAALDASNLEMVEVMYQTLTQPEHQGAAKNVAVH